MSIFLKEAEVETWRVERERQRENTIVSYVGYTILIQLAMAVSLGNWVSRVMNKIALSRALC